MVTVLCMDIEPETLAKLQRRRRPPILREAASPAHVVAALEHDPTATEILVLGPEVRNPLRLVHHAHALDEDLAVLLLVSVESLNALREALGFLPSLRGDVSCVPADDAEALSAAIEDAAKCTQKRRIFRAMSSASAARVAGAPLETPLFAPFLVRLLDHSPVGTVVLNSHGRIQILNPAATELLEHPERDSIGRSFVLLFQEPEWERLSGYLARCSATERHFAGEVFSCTTPSGRERHLEVSAAPFPGTRRERGTLVFLQDRAEPHARSAWLDRRVHVRGLSGLAGFALDVARRFHGPLASIAGAAGSLRKTLDFDPTLAAGIEWIRDEARKALRVAEQLLTLGGHEPLRLESIDLCELVHAALRPLGATLPSRIALEVDLKPDLPTVLADAEQVRVILKNLVLRAADTIGEESGRIGVSIGVADPRPGWRLSSGSVSDSPAGPCVYLQVGDDAPAEEAPDSLQALDPGRGSRSVRSDLALAAVLGSATAQGALLEMDFPSSGGTAVRVLSPLHSAEPSQSEEHQAAWTILLLCQEPSALAVTDRILEHFGFMVLSTADAAKAQAILRSRAQVDAVLLDIDPAELAAELVAELARSGLPVILASGEETSREASRWLGMEPAAFVTRPFTAELLIRTVRGVLPEDRKPRGVR